MASRDGENRPDGHRRKWDRNEYEKKAKARAREERGLDREAEDERSRKDNRKDLKQHKDKNPRDRAVEEADDDWDAFDEDWDGYKGNNLGIG